MVSQGKLGLVNLSSGKVEITRTPEAVLSKFLGGRGLNMFYMYKHMPPRLDPFSPHNPLIVGSGLLTGTLAPNAARFNISAKSPESQALGDANCGGFFGPRLRNAGFDRLIITGKSSFPCYLYLEGEKIEIRAAKDYWGLNCHAAQQKFWEELGRDTEALVIGRAGENLVRFACVMNGVKDAAGRGGMGAVFGSKNLKAVVARGTQDIKIADPGGLMELRVALQDYIGKSKVTKVLGTMGTPLLYEVSNALGAIRTHNSQLNAFEDSLNAEAVHRYVEKMLACQSCIVHCRHRNTLGGEGPEYSTLALLGANCGLADTAQVIELNNVCNDLGLDTSSAGSIIPWAMELYQRGILNGANTDRELHFGDYTAVKRLLIDIAERRGLGDLLAESTRAARRLGPQARDYLIAVKGLPQSDPHDCRYIKSFALGIAVASRGADHLRNRPTLDIFDLPQEFVNQIYGQPVKKGPAHYETKEVVVAFSEDIFAVIDSLGLCKFICHGFNSPHFLKYEHFASLIEKVTGMVMTAEEIRGVGRRVVDLEKLINLREGLTRADDTLPRRYFQDPMPLGATKGHHIDPKEFQSLLSRYYAHRGWDDEGVPPVGRKEEIEQLVAI